MNYLGEMTREEWDAQVALLQTQINNLRQLLKRDLAELEALQGKKDK